MGYAPIGLFIVAVKYIADFAKRRGVKPPFLGFSDRRSDCLCYRSK